MITDHNFVGLRQWGIDPPATSPCQADGCGMPRSQHAAACPSTLMIKGQAFPCDMATPHDGWAHANKQLEAIWGEP